ncbi:hypothetical protein C8Q80DRAFT_1143423 [Daedaleopsis nitida]|nr:hypothetical protein C8Q80DRAFT_1143423 [Daedaleopsis nitida]
MIQLTFSSRDPIDSQVIDASGKLLYQISTPRTLGTHLTTMCDAQNQVVGTYKRVMFSDMVTLHGAKLGGFNDWLPKRNIVSRSRMMIAPDGKLYEWTKRERGFTLTDVATGQEIAASQRGSRLGRQRSELALSVQQEGLTFIDAIVLSFTIWEHKVQAARQAGNAA